MSYYDGVSVGAKVSYGSEDAFLIGAGVVFDTSIVEVSLVELDLTAGKFTVEAFLYLDDSDYEIQGEYAISDDVALWVECYGEFTGIVGITGGLKLTF